MTLGRKTYTVRRIGQGDYDEDGVWVDSSYKDFEISANIQGALFWNSVKFNTVGDVTRQAISIRADFPLYMNTLKQKGDLVLYDGCWWEVRDSRPYTNLRATKHWESIAVLVDGEEIQRKESIHD